MGKLQGRVEPYQNGTWRFWCDCGAEDWRKEHPCSRIVNDSEINFRCERAIIEASDTPCMIVHHLPPLIEAYQRKKKRDDAAKFLRALEAKKQEALKTLGITEADIVKPTQTTSGGTT